MTEATEQQFLSTATERVDKLRNVLELEYKAMSASDINCLQTLLDEKSLLLDELLLLEPRLIEMLADPKLKTSAESLVRLILDCQQLNERNRTVAMVGLDQARKTMGLLRNMLNLDEQVAYDAEGAVEYNRDKRYLTSG